MYGTLSPSIEEDDLLALAARQIDAFRPEREDTRLDALARSEAMREPAWRQGYELADEILIDLELAGDTAAAIPIESCLEELGVEVEDVALGDAKIRGVAFTSPEHRPTILVNTGHRANHSAAGRRFTLAHELCHLLFDRSHGRELALASGPWAAADIERRANAFAAMFLMPTERIRQSINEIGAIRERAQVHTIASRLQTGFLATLEHLTNLGFLGQAERQAIETAE